MLFNKIADNKLLIANNTIINERTDNIKSIH